MTLLARLARPAVKAAGVPSISDDGTFITVQTLSQLLSFGGLRTSAGVPVSSASALSLPTMYAAARNLAEDIAKLPLLLYRRLPDDGKERATDHELYRVFHRKPNPEMTSFSWREAMMRSLIVWGNAYNEVLQDGAGRTQIWPLDAERMTVRWENGGKAFYYLKRSGERKRMRDGTVFHVLGPTSDGLIGQSLVETMRAAFGEAIATREFGANFYRNMARPATVLQHPSGLSEGAIERLAKQMEEVRGSDNSGKTVVLEEGMQVKEIGVPPEGAQYTETRKMQREDIATMARIPQHKVGILDHGTYANVEQESLNYNIDSLLSWTSRIEQAIDGFFLEDEQDLNVEHLIDALLRADAKTRAESLMVQRQAGVLSKHQWQRIENRNPSGDDDIWVPIANHEAVPIDKTGMPIPEAEPVVSEPPVPDIPPLDGTQPPQLTVVKSVKNLRCEGRLATGEPCGKLLAEVATPPYRLTCRFCKSVAVAGDDVSDADPMDLFARLTDEASERQERMVATFAKSLAEVASRPIAVDARMEPGAIVVNLPSASVRKTVERNRAGQITSVREEPA